MPNSLLQQFNFVAEVCARKRKRFLSATLSALFIFFSSAFFANSAFATQRDIENHQTDELLSAHIAVATNFIRPMKALTRAFEKQSTHKLVISYASSGKIYAQIMHGAPFDVFLSADQEKPIALEKNRKVAENRRFTYAIGRLVLWSANSERRVNLNALKEQRFNKIALANPRFAPYGKAAVAVLDGLGIAEATKSAWVMGESISQTYQFAASGNVDYGFIAYSQLPRHGKGILIDQKLHPKIVQDAVLLKNATNNPVALKFFEFLQSDSAREIINSHGYDLPIKTH